MKPDCQRASIHVVDARIIMQRNYEDGQYIIRLSAPECVRSVQPGQFVYLRCADDLLMRRPYSIMNVSKEEGWMDLYYVIKGAGSSLLASRRIGDVVNCMGPIGRGFKPSRRRCRPLILGGGAGMPPVLFLAHRLRADHDNCRPLVLLGSERPFPFETCKAREIVTGMPPGSTLAMLEDKGIPARLCSSRGYAGCYQGRVDALADAWLAGLDAEALKQVEMFACGPSAMLNAVAALAAKYGVPCQICVEEYMACGVGACAGCVVETVKDGKRIMRRACVDGPVFDAAEVYHS